MVYLNKAQRKALKAVFDRETLYTNGCGPSAIVAANGWSFGYDEESYATAHRIWWYEHPVFGRLYKVDAATIIKLKGYARPITYRQFRKHCVRPGPGCVMVQWVGMWLGIEPDGYTHS